MKTLSWLCVASVLLLGCSSSPSADATVDGSSSDVLILADTAPVDTGADAAGVDVGADTPATDSVAQDSSSNDVTSSDVSVVDVGDVQIDTPTLSDVPAPSDAVVTDAPIGAAARCLGSGGTIDTGLCCDSAGDYPSTCGFGACTCSPTNSHSVARCNCPSGTCFNPAVGCTPTG